VKSAALAAQPAVLVDAGPVTAPLRSFSSVRRHPANVAAFCLVELQKLSHDGAELLTRAVQPVLWMVIFGETFTRAHAIPTGHLPYLSFLAPGIVAQSGLFVAIFYGIEIIWERDAGILTKLLVTLTPRSALIIGKALSAGVRATAEVIVIIVLSAILGVTLDMNALHLLAAFVIIMLGSAFFACLSMRVAGVVMKRDRLMGIGQLLTMPLFFASNALYPVSVMPAWLRALARGNPMSYELRTLRGLLVGAHAHLGQDFAALALAVVVGVVAASSLVDRLAR
jgi:ABC-2 type transport system permease protein